jgi:hypothetical protein
VKRGLILLDLDFVTGWSKELKAMNAGKEGSKYRYQNHSSNYWQLCMHTFCRIDNWRASCVD